jgi:integrase
LFQSRGQRGKHLDGRLEVRSVLRIVREIGRRAGLHVWCHGLRHTAITMAIEKGQQGGRRARSDSPFQSAPDARYDAHLS